jgi:hypothetical protein
VIVCFDRHSQWIEPASTRLTIEWPRSGDRKIERFEALRADGASEPSIASSGVFPDDPALLVSDCVEGG